MLVTGDDKICAEVREKIPGIHTAAVKTGIAAQNACSLAPVEARQRIGEAVAAALGEIQKIKPYTIPGPYRLNISNRDPAQRLFDQDVEGADLWETFHQAVNSTSYGHYQEDPIDDGSFRWP
ncbi:M55 family metallopeptidase [Phycisphaerales bacterium AB-hyl4]|uniref:M55 family metallopeptidase n=1 Tax=Natronomicrosphaera hydrolytica TaxID=3242702 RepID=A0ABV4U981_9BACT